MCRDGVGAAVLTFASPSPNPPLTHGTPRGTIVRPMRNPPRRLSPGDHMKMKSLTAALAAAGVLAAGSAGAFSLTPEWLKSKPEAKPVAVATTPPAPVPMLPAAGQVP